MNKPMVLAALGVIVGAGVAFAAFTFLLGGSPESASAAPARVVSVPGKLGPHITLSDRVFNLIQEPGQQPVYLKLQAVIEFETQDLRWERVLTGCGASSHGARFVPSASGGFEALMVSSLPGGRSAARAAESGAGGDPCQEDLAALMTEFEHGIGSGRALIEDAVTSIVTGHTASEIATPAGKDALKAEIQQAVHELIEEPRVARVLFLNFITQ